MRLKIFLIILAIVYSIFLLTFLQNFGLNFFSKIKNEEVYFLSFNDQNFTIFSNSYQECKINNQSVFLDYGTNNFPSQPYVFVNCSNRTIWFKLNSTTKQNIQLRSYNFEIKDSKLIVCLLYTSPSPRD